MSGDQSRIFTDGSALIIEASVRAGAEVYVGYPITPANRLYHYAQSRFPRFLAAPDEISAAQWAGGLAATGSIPVTGTSFPGFALMLESINMLWMMELPFVVVLAQRLGPSTGSATSGAQGDLLLLRGMISGGYEPVVLCPSNLQECWSMAADAVSIARKLRTPVVLLTSKEMMMSQRSVPLRVLTQIENHSKPCDPSGITEYVPYEAGADDIPVFLPVGNDHHRVRLNSSTHGKQGLIQKDTPEALENTSRVARKVRRHMEQYDSFELDSGGGPLLVAYGISAGAVRAAVRVLRKRNQEVSMMIIKVILPVSDEMLQAAGRYRDVIIVEENESGQLANLWYGHGCPKNVRQINRVGKMISTEVIIAEVESCLTVC